MATPVPRRWMAGHEAGPTTEMASDAGSPGVAVTSGCDYKEIAPTRHTTDMLNRDITLATVANNLMISVGRYLRAGSSPGRRLNHRSKALPAHDLIVKVADVPHKERVDAYPA